MSALIFLIHNTHLAQLPTLDAECNSFGHLVSNPSNLSKNKITIAC